MGIAPLHFVEQRDQYTRAAGSNGVAQGNRTAVDVELRPIKSEFFAHRYRLGRKGLVGLNQVQVRHPQSGLFQGTLTGRNRPQTHHTRIHPCCCIAANPGHRLQAKLLCLFGAHHYHGSSPIVEPRRVACRDHPILLKRWAQLGQSLCGRLAWLLIRFKDGWPFPAWNLDRHDLIAEDSRCNRLDRFLLTVQGKLIQFFPC